MIQEHNVLRTLATLLDTQYPSRIAYLGAEGPLCSFLVDYAKNASIEFQELRLLEIGRWPFGGEYFEAIIVEDDAFAADGRQIKAVKRALQKNRNLILISSKLNATSLTEVMEPFGFSDFSTITEADPSLGYNVNINLMKKWFTFAQ